MLIYGGDSRTSERTLSGILIAHLADDSCAHRRSLRRVRKRQENCDGDCDGRSDFGAKTDVVDTFGSRRINNLRALNTRPLHPAYRPVRQIFFAQSGMCARAFVVPSSDSFQPQISIVEPDCFARGGVPPVPRL
jgi:hypothetical protein